MRIAVWDNLPSGGGKRALFEHVRGLLALGHQLESWRPQTADPDFLPLSSMIPEHVVPLDWPSRPNRGDSWQITLHTERQLAAMGAHCRSCAEQINAGGFDLLFANSCQFFRVTSIGRHVRLPGALYLQEPFRWLYEALPSLPWPAPPAGSVSLGRPGTWRAAFIDWRRIRNLRVQAREEVENARAYERILANSYFSRESILRAYGLESEVCYLGVDAERFADEGLPREGFVVGLGSIVPEKNIGMAVRALATLPPPRPRLVWIGNMSVPSCHQEVTALASSLGVDLRIKVRLPEAELLDALRRASVMLYTSRLEPFGLAPLEANACGVPVVAVAEGGVRETIRHEVNGLLADSEPAALGRAVARLLGDPELARRLGQAGRRLVVSDWSLEAATTRLEEKLLACAGLAARAEAPEAAEVA